MNGGDAKVDLDRTTTPTFSEEEQPAKTVDKAEELQTKETIEAGSSSGVRSPPRRVQVWQRVELGLLAALIVVVWGLLLLPVVLYYLPEDEVLSMLCEVLILHVLGRIHDTPSNRLELYIQV